MSLLNTLKADLLIARKAKDADNTATLSTLIGELETIHKKTGKPIDDAQVISLIKLSLSTLKQVISQAGEAGLNTIKLEEAIPLYEKYIPAQLTEDEIRQSIHLLEVEGVELNIGKVQSHFRAMYPGRYDAKLVTEIFKTL